MAAGRGAGGGRPSDAIDRQPKPPKCSSRPASFRWAGEDSERTGIVLPGQLRNGDLIVFPPVMGLRRMGLEPADPATR